MSKKSRAGVGTWVLVLIGSAIAFLSGAFRKNKSSSLDQLIQELLVKSEQMSPAQARMWAAVARHETGNYKSPLSQPPVNNLFGMKFPTVRQTSANGKTASGFATFATPADSVRDLSLYHRARLYPFHFATVADLVAFMKSKGYYEDTFENYLAGVTRAFNKIA